MVIGIFLSVGVGWLIGGLGNWFADQLPQWPKRPLQFETRHYLRSCLQPWRMAGLEGARPWRHGLLAAAMAVTFAVDWLRFSDDWGQLLVAWFFTAWLLVVLVIDFEHRRVLNVMLPSAILVALVAPLLTLFHMAHLTTFSSALLGGIAGFLTFLVIFIVGRGRMMGAGDVKLAGVIGLIVGYPWVWAALVSGIFLGGIAALFLLARYRSAKSYMAYGPYLAMGALLVLWLYWP